MKTPVILLVGSRCERAPVSLAGLLAGNVSESCPRNSADGAEENTEARWAALFADFCAAQHTACVWLRHMQEAQVTVHYAPTAAHLRVRGLSTLQGTELRQEDITGVWYRGLPTVPRLAADDDQAYAERETEAFWEGYGHHAPARVLNRPRTAGLRPATWDPILLRELIRSRLGFATPRDGLRPPGSPHQVEKPTSSYRTLSGQSPVAAEEIPACLEHCAWLEQAHARHSAVLAVNVGTDVLLARQGADGLLESWPQDSNTALEAALATATRAVAQVLGEDFGVTFWQVDLQADRFLFRDFTPNPPAHVLLALRPSLFTLAWRFLTSNGR